MAQSSTDQSIVVYADYVCPFCYLGRASLDQYLDDVDDPPRVEWRFFDLRSQKRGPDGEIDHSVDDGKDDAYFEQAQENVRRLADRYGVEMTQDFSLEVDSWNAHQVALSLQRDHDEETFEAFHDGVFDALWKEGRDIGDPDVLVGIAEEAGVSADEVHAALADDDLRDELQEHFEASQRAGVTGVPTFVYDQYAARGAVPPEQLRRLVSE